MRKLIVTEFLTLDGVMDNPAWTAPYWNDEIAAFKAAEQSACDALLLGRVTYDGLAAAWPQSTDEGAEQMNGMPKYVVSGHLQEATWNNSHLIRENVAGEITKLKNQGGKDILVYGSGELTRFLPQHGLIDQLNLLVYPVVLGRGKRLFGAEVPGRKLGDSQTFSSGVIGLTHARKPEIEALRHIILGADARIREGVKWNSLSFLSYSTAFFSTSPHSDSGLLRRFRSSSIPALRFGRCRCPCGWTWPLHLAC